ncbi:MAG: NAD(P)-dependent alcohol dehydrogenase, partial [Leptonema sp. (in: Bacteria)]|nr:NAD(P)-dependent alcohol dehydrogenase [Leptonema sp. (in: bacteria)]
MRAYIFESFGQKNLKIVERPIPKPESGELLLKMKSVSLNFRDHLMIEGNYNPKLRLPIVPCSDGVGEVVEVGSSVSGFKIGDRVIPIFASVWQDGDVKREYLRHSLGGPIDGTLQEYMTVKADGAVQAPVHLTDDEAATLACAGLTAWSAIIEKGKIKPGERLLTLGTGGVSIFALQFGLMAGAKVCITSGSNDKLNRAIKLGANYTINYKDQPEWHKEVIKRFSLNGVDHVVEVGGMGTLERSVKSVRAGGSIYLIGVLSGKSAPVDLTPVLMQNIRIQGVVVGHRRSFIEMNRAIEQHQIQPVVDKTFSFE